MEIQQKTHHKGVIERSENMCHPEYMFTVPRIGHPCLLFFDRDGGGVGRVVDLKSGEILREPGLVGETL